MNKQDYISLTDMIKPFGDETIIKNWLRNRNTVEFLGIWEQIYNPDFNSVEFDLIKKQTGLNSFVLSVKKWVDATNAVGVTAKTGRYGSGTYAHKDIAFEFGSWLSAEFKLYLIKEFQRLKDEENSSKKLEWNLQRTLSKINYRIHTDAIKEELVPSLYKETNGAKKGTIDPSALIDTSTVNLLSSLFMFEKYYNFKFTAIFSPWRLFNKSLRLLY